MSVHAHPFGQLPPCIPLRCLFPHTTARTTAVVDGAFFRVFSPMHSLCCTVFFEVCASYFCHHSALPQHRSLIVGCVVRALHERQAMQARRATACVGAVGGSPCASWANKRGALPYLSHAPLFVVRPYDAHQIGQDCMYVSIRPISLVLTI